MERRLAKMPPLVFAGEVAKLEEEHGEVALGHSFLLQDGDGAKSFEHFGANIIRDMFRLLLQIAIVLTFGGQMPTINVCFFIPSPHALSSSHTSFDLDLCVISTVQMTCSSLLQFTIIFRLEGCRLVNLQSHDPTQQRPEME
jgi:hypothetical protein